MKGFVCTANRLCLLHTHPAHVSLLYFQAVSQHPPWVPPTPPPFLDSSIHEPPNPEAPPHPLSTPASHPSRQPKPPTTMRPHPHQKWALQHPPAHPAPKSPLRPTRLHARTATLSIRTAHLPPQARLNDREAQLQEYLGAERATRGDGSPLHANPQQVFTFSATDEAPANTVLDDVTGFVDPVPGRERGGEGKFVTGAVVAVGEWRRGVDGEHWRMVRGLVGGAEGVDVATVVRVERGVDVATAMRVERGVEALGF